MSAVPALGHVVPLLELACALQLGGHEVRFATNEQSHAVIAAAGLHPVAAGMGTREMVEERRRRWPETDAQPATVWATRMWAQVMAPSTLKDLLLRIAEWSPDLVVHDEGEYAAPVAATMADVPWITHAWGSPLRPVSDLAELEELASGLWESCGQAVPPAAGLYAHAVVNPCPSMLQAPPLPGTSVVWPIRPRTLQASGPALQADAYIGFGTVPSFSNARSELTAAVRACTSRGLRVVVTAPGEELRRELAEIDQRLVDAREFVSLTSLISSCKVVISHAGAGTVLASLAAGVPVILLPRGAPSQARMADACERAGVGRRCDPGGLDAALEEVMHDSRIAAAASAAACEIAYLPQAETVVALIESLLGASASCLTWPIHPHRVHVPHTCLWKRALPVGSPRFGIRTRGVGP